MRMYFSPTFRVFCLPCLPLRQSFVAEEPAGVPAVLEVFHLGQHERRAGPFLRGQLTPV